MYKPRPRYHASALATTLGRMAGSSTRQRARLKRWVRRTEASFWRLCESQVGTILPATAHKEQRETTGEQTEANGLRSDQGLAHLSRSTAFDLADAEVIEGGGQRALARRPAGLRDDGEIESSRAARGVVGGTVVGGRRGHRPAAVVMRA